MMFRTERKPTGIWLVDWIVDAYTSLGEIFLMNLLWFVLSLPVITAPPAFGALIYGTNLIAHDESVTWRTFFVGFRLNFWRSYRWFFLYLFVVAVAVSNIYFYRQFDATWGDWAEILALSLLFLWVLLNVYTFPLLLEQSDRRIMVALRNSLVLYIRRPGVAFGAALVILALMGLSLRFAWPAWIVIVPSLLAYLANRAAIYGVDQLSGVKRRQVAVQKEDDGGAAPPGGAETNRQE